MYIYKQVRKVDDKKNSAFEQNWINTGFSLSCTFLTCFYK